MGVVVFVVVLVATVAGPETVGVAEGPLLGPLLATWVPLPCWATCDPLFSWVGEVELPVEPGVDCGCASACCHF